MNLHKLIFTKNACYKAGKKITPKGIMVHSTGANNPDLKRYVGPDDGLLGKNKYNNHWNKAMVRQVCAHAFIGKLADGSIATYQTLPWDHRGWHCGSGKKGNGNNTHIGIEICEDGLVDANYFAKVYKEAVELCAHLCKEYKLTEKDILCHSEGYKKGIASNHSDVMHWFPKHGKSMNTFRADVKALLEKDRAAAKAEAITIKLDVLKRGNKGDQVKALQLLLKGYGYDIGSSGADGSFGPATEKALKKYQGDHKLDQDGSCGPKTWASLLGA
jgi:N-acetyl-anhydromuramyl-L-alanine amidase AmpD